MGKVIWSHRARTDLQDIIEYIANDKPHTARMFGRKIIGVPSKLQDFPHSGRIVPEHYDSQYREVIYGNYRIVYRLKKDDIEIVTIHHSARLLDLS